MAPSLRDLTLLMEADKAAMFAVLRENHGTRSPEFQAALALYNESAARLRRAKREATRKD